MSADLALSAGVEPTLLVPETSVLSIELREQNKVQKDALFYYYTIFRRCGK